MVLGTGSTSPKKEILLPLYLVEVISEVSWRENTHLTSLVWLTVELIFDQKLVVTLLVQSFCNWYLESVVAYASAGN